MRPFVSLGWLCINTNGQLFNPDSASASNIILTRAIFSSPPSEKAGVFLSPFYVCYSPILVAKPKQHTLDSLRRQLFHFRHRPNPIHHVFFSQNPRELCRLLRLFLLLGPRTNREIAVEPYLRNVWIVKLNEKQFEVLTKLFEMKAEPKFS